MNTERPPLSEPRRVENPFAVGELSRPTGAAGAMTGLVAVEQQRAIAEVQARMIMARATPRDPIRAMELITNDCCRVSLAESAFFSYQRGGTDIEGETIRLLEAIAQRWGNISSGIKEMARHGEYSDCVAYAWDLESGYYDERQFQVRHWRDTKGGGYRLTDERDIYESIANFGQRRKRAVLQTVIPGDVIEAAGEQCRRTMAAKADTSPDGVKKLVEAFAEFGVTVAQIEARIQRRLDSIRPAQMVGLRKVFNSLRDGMSEAGDWFTAVPLAEPKPTPADPDPAPGGGKGRGRPRREAGPANPPGDETPTQASPAPAAEGLPPAEPANVGRQSTDRAAAARGLAFD